ncbi:AraC family transcriptional regulator [Kordiimonas marina]|uniref:AraC family transcriptional regulator n=1 Tax=Kordiimonas marina TaxID=2872312 RepID=UPI001FF1C42B|nr:helix-turn-helix domain-containing protein [Kordiimonas marina]MCJ9429684.1 helix-turn-helix domain-containing protein [Kordiimonas marina]
MGEIDTILRYSAFGLLLWLAVLCWRKYRHLITGRLGVWAAVCSAAYLHTSKAGVMLGGVNLGPVLLPIASAGPVFVWLFCLSQFEDHFEITWVHKLVGAAKVLTGVGAYYAWQPGTSVLHAPLFAATVLIGLGIMLHLGFVIWRGRNDDLVEDRCRFRMWVSMSVVVVTLAILLGEPVAIGLGLEHYLLPLQAAAVLGITLFLHWQVAGDSGTELFAFAPALAGGIGIPAIPEATETITPEDRHDLRALEGVMAEKTWLEPGLTIARLAECAGLPEHRLRRLINQHLGYRNFSDYLNHHRIGAAKERLGSVEERHLPVLTIAMDLGYQSLGPFNRAFKERTGVTPTEFRRQALADF